MERENFEQNLATAFAFWKAGEMSEKEIRNFDKYLNFARENGIELTIKIPKNVFGYSVDNYQLSLKDAEYYSDGLDGDNFVFNITCRDDDNAVRKNHLKGIILDGEPVLILENTCGILLKFKREEVTSIKPR